MKVLAIMGSPKGKGNGYRVTRRIEERMQQLGDVEFEYLFLKDANVQQCRGCFVCVAKGEERCPLKDDRVTIEKQIDESDGVILVSPVYVQNVSGLTTIIRTSSSISTTPKSMGSKTLWPGQWYDAFCS